MGIEEIGCCGAYCGTCKEFISNLCKGCKIGYSNGERDINRAKCKIKVCCIKKGFASCADCNDLETCEIINDFYNKKSYKYKKYHQAIQFIVENGYEEFLKISDTWKNAHGKYPKKQSS